MPGIDVDGAVAASREQFGGTVVAAEDPPEIDSSTLGCRRVSSADSPVRVHGG